jgi:hypothetical protein
LNAENRRTTGFDQQVVGRGYDKHDRVPGGDNATDGVNRRLEHDAVLRRAQIGTPELIFRSNLPLDVFADLAVGLPQLLGDVTA